MARSLLRRRGHLVFCHYERSEVIQKQVLLAMRLLLSLRSIASDKIRMASHGQARFASDKGLVAESHSGFAKKILHGSQ